MEASLKTLKTAEETAAQYKDFDPQILKPGKNAHIRKRFGSSTKPKK